MTPAALVTARLFVLRRAAVGSCFQGLLQVQELPHEIQVGTYDRARVLHHFVRLDHRQTHVSHYVGDGDCRTARNTRLAMHEDSAAGFSCLFCNHNDNGKFSMIYSP